MAIEGPKPFDPREGKPDLLAGLSPELREARKKALEAGTVLKFDEEHGIANPLLKEAGRTALAGTPAERNEAIKQGQPWPRFLDAARRYKEKNKDPRPVAEVAKELWQMDQEKGSEEERRAA